MRKINDIQDWFKFIDDVEGHCGETALFGLSQNGEDWDGHIMVKRVWSYGAGGRHLEGLFVADANGNGADCNDLKRPAKYYDDLCGNYSTPFFVVDTGANYRWL